MSITNMVTYTQMPSHELLAKVKALASELKEAGVTPPAAEAAAHIQAAELRECYCGRPATLEDGWCAECDIERQEAKTGKKAVHFLKIDLRSNKGGRVNRPCPGCGEPAHVCLKPEIWLVGVAPKQTELMATMPVTVCAKCDETFLEEDAEDIRQMVTSAAFPWID